MVISQLAVHLDHIILSKSLLPLVNDQQLDVKTIRVDNYFQNFYQYDNTISDHLPVGLRLNINPTNLNEIKNSKETNIEFFNLNGQKIKSIKKGNLMIRKSDRKSEKIILIKNSYLIIKTFFVFPLSNRSIIKELFFTSFPSKLNLFTS